MLLMTYNSSIKNLEENTMQIKSLIISLSLSALIPLSYATDSANSSTPITATSSNTCVTGQPDTSNNYTATKWYRDSVERNAQYHQVFSLGLEKVKQKVAKEKLEHKNWAVIMDIDETVLDNSFYEKANILSCRKVTMPTMYESMELAVSTATPGAHNFTCSIQKSGGKVVLVTNRDGTYDSKIQAATLDNLQKAGICYDTVIFANGSNDTNKTPRFNAAITGDYKNIVATKKLGPVNVLAYFGDNIQDFPNVIQKDAIKLDANDDFYNKFGQEYFSLPNPTYGSWEYNQFN